MKITISLLLALALILSLGGCSTPAVSTETTAASTVQTSLSGAFTTAAATTTTRPPETTATATATVQTIATTTATTVHTTTTKPPETTTTTTTKAPETTTTTTATTELPLDPITALLISTQWCTSDIADNPELLEKAKNGSETVGFVFYSNGTGGWGTTNPGKWIYTGNDIAYYYTQKNGNKLAELHLELVENGNGPYLRIKPAGIIDGQPVTWVVKEYYPLENFLPTEEPGENNISLALGDTASTDIIELTVSRAALAYYAEGMSTKTSPVHVRSGSYYPVVNTDTVCLPSDSKSSLFHASKGRVLVCLDFTVKNLDRTHLDTDDGVFAFTVSQGDKTADVRGYDPNYKDGVNWLEFSVAVFSVNGVDFYSNNSTNLLIDAEESLEIKAVFIAGFEAEDLSAPFELTVLLQDSNDSYQSFVYAVGADE